jgi:hypothetical protein
VIAQDPGAGVRAQRGSTVTITVGRAVGGSTTTTTEPEETTTTTEP